MTLVSPDIATCPACLARAVRPGRPPLPLPLHQLHELRAALHDHRRRALRPADDDDARLPDVPRVRRRVRRPRRPPLPRPARRVLRLRPAALPERARRRRADWRVDARARESSPATAPRTRDAEQRSAPTRILVGRRGATRCAADASSRSRGSAASTSRATPPTRTAVDALRERKHRWGKPLAIMVRDLEAARAYCEVDAQEAELLAGTSARSCCCADAAPLRARSRTRPRRWLPGVADGLAEIGVMLPYTPLHHLLLRRVDGPLVMTSGNLSDEPIATGNAEALDAAGGIADAFLLHDRDIYSRYDDSRRARGRRHRRAGAARARLRALPARAALRRPTPTSSRPAPSRRTRSRCSPATTRSSRSTSATWRTPRRSRASRTRSALYERLFRIEPRDRRPRPAPRVPLDQVGARRSTCRRSACSTTTRTSSSVTAEHGVAERVVGIAFDGTGYGEDGRIWGGEVLLADWAGYERFAHLRYVPMPGGAGGDPPPGAHGARHAARARAARPPGRRTAALAARRGRGAHAPHAWSSAGVNSPLTSSMGRLFDAVAALAGVADDARYEGEAAILLEARADPAAQGAYAVRARTPAEPADRSSSTRRRCSPRFSTTSLLRYPQG